MTMIGQATREASGNQEQHPRGRRAVKLLVVPAATVLLAAAGWAALRDEATEAAAFACVADGTTAVLPNDGTSPVEACRAQWEAGNMQPGVATAPPLVACVGDEGAVEVIPAEGSGACDAAGLGEWTRQPEYEEVGTAVREARVGFHDRYQAAGNGCATEQDWRAALDGVLEQAGSPWRLEVNRVEPERRCFDIGSLNPATRTVVLVGVPGDYSIGCDPRTGC